tara:strand:+ start:1136 stop:2140 length:1005 start_codon:yes stop_codon:yes gene_type:complete
MSTTIGNLIDRVFREYLEPNDSLTPYSALASSLTDSATTVSYDNNLVTSEEEMVMDAGTILECEQELMYCTGIDTVNNQITVVRGALGTTAAEHSSGDIIKIAPVFTRKAVFDAIVDQIENLYPTLFAVATQSVTSNEGYTLLGTYDTPGDYNYLVSPLKAVSQFTDFSAGTDTTDVAFRGVGVELIQLPNPFTYTDADGTERTITYSSGPNVVNAVQFRGIAAGHTVYVDFKKKFVVPTAETSTLATVGLESEYEPIIMAGVAAQMISGRDIPVVTTQYVSDQLGVQNFPVGSSNTIRNSLLQYQQLLIQQARKNLRARFPEAVTFANVNYLG